MKTGPKAVTDTLSAIGIAHHQSSRWQRIAAIPEAEEKAAKERQSEAGGDKTSEKQQKKALGKNFPKRSPKAKDIAAAESGMKSGVGHCPTPDPATRHWLAAGGETLTAAAQWRKLPKSKAADGLTVRAY